MSRISSPEGLVSAFQTQLDHQWQRFREIESDDSARGRSYERALRELLEEYFGGQFEFYANCSVMDPNLHCFEEFGNGVRNEIDVVGLFPHSSPRIVLEETEMTWIPLEGVGLIAEVKSRLDKQRLDSDLEKLAILRNLESDPNDRFVGKVEGSYTVNHQIHCLVYDRASISDETLQDRLRDTDDWDLILIAEDDTLIVNDTLPVIEYISSRAVISQALSSNGDDSEKAKTPIIPENEEQQIISFANGFAWLIIALSMSIPVPFAVGAVGAISRLTMHSVSGTKFEATTLVMDDDLVEWEVADSGDTGDGS